MRKSVTDIWRPMHNSRTAHHVPLPALQRQKHRPARSVRLLANVLISKTAAAVTLLHTPAKAMSNRAAAAPLLLHTAGHWDQQRLGLEIVWHLLLLRGLVLLL